MFGYCSFLTLLSVLTKMEFQLQNNLNSLRTFDTTNKINPSLQPKLHHQSLSKLLNVSEDAQMLCFPKWSSCSSECLRRANDVSCTRVRGGHSGAWTVTPGPVESGPVNERRRCH